MGARAATAAPAASVGRAADAAGRRAAAGDALLHPLSLAALALLLVNDHVLKAGWPGPATGKLSDVAGLVFLPILLVSAHELVRAAAGRWRRPSRAAARAAATATGLLFVLVKTIPAAADVAGLVFGVAQWSLSLPFRALMGAPIPTISPAVVVVDPTDLLALPCLLIGVWVMSSRRAE